MGDLIHQPDGRGQTVDFDYDALGRLVERRADPNGPDGTKLVTDRWVYDVPGTNGSGANSLPPGKDGNGLLLYEERYIGSVSDASRRIFSRTYQYDTDLHPAGHSTSINPEGAIVDPDSGAAVYQTDIQNDPYFSRPVSVTWPGSGMPEVGTYTKYDINDYVTEEGRSAYYDIADRFL